jgi:tryptophanyl-tRNA synthetase
MKSVYRTYNPPKARGRLQGAKGKMSSSNPASYIALTDSPAEVKKKINKYAFSGGGVTLEEHKKNGGNVDIDIPF